MLIKFLGPMKTFFKRLLCSNTISSGHLTNSFVFKAWEKWIPNDLPLQRRTLQDDEAQGCRRSWTSPFLPI